MSEELYFGWKEENESLHDVSALEHSARCMVSASDVPDTVECSWMQDDQGPLPFCHSSMSTGAGEILAGMATAEPGKPPVFPQYSRYFSAIMNLRQDGDDRYPDGASIRGAMLAAIKGLALESLMPYLKSSNQYSNRIPESVQANAKLHRIKSITPPIRSYDEMNAIMPSGRYVMAFGLQWTQGLANLRNVRTCPNLTGGQVLGGHAVLSSPSWITQGGDKWYALDNSHNGWGLKRRVFMSPQWWDWMLRRSGQYGAFAASDIALDDFTPKPRDFSFAKPLITL